MKLVYNRRFTDYKSEINSFIVKIFGRKSDFTLYKYSTGLDEYKYFPLCACLPLQDTGLGNGKLCVIAKTHEFINPYRGISFSPPFVAYEDVLRKYLVPI